MIQQLLNENSIMLVGSCGGAASPSTNPPGETASFELISDRAVQADSSIPLYLKIKRRVPQEDLPVIFGTLLDVASGNLGPQFSKVVALPAHPQHTRSGAFFG